MAKFMQGWGLALLLAFAMFSLPVLSILSSQSAFAIGLVAPVPVHPLRPHLVVRAGKAAPRRAPLKSRCLLPASQKGKPAKVQVKRAAKSPPAPPVPLPQNLVGSLSKKTLAPGVVYRFYHGGLNINVVEVDMVDAPVQVRPVLAGSSFNRLADVKNHARQVQALAAVNANYFKPNGTPLGTLIIDREWVAGPLYDRVSMGITQCGFIRMDRVNLYGILRSSRPGAQSIWVNNINQPRRTGSRLILYSRRWGSNVRMQYAGCLVAVNSRGEVVDQKTTVIEVPWGGFVLSDKKGSQISQLRKGDLVELAWKTRPDSWKDVVQAISGGPRLIKDGELYVDLNAEKFRKAWTGRQIKARTAAGVSGENHLLLATIEGPHTLWDFAKFLQKLGAVDAMNLDGGGSTTMVVNGVTVTRNANSYQRRVASSLAVIETGPSSSVLKGSTCSYAPRNDLTDFYWPADAFTPGDLFPELAAPCTPAAGGTEVVPLSAEPAPVNGEIVSAAPAGSPLGVP